MYDTALAQLFAYHARILRDGARVDAYRNALLHCVRPGDVVLDLGSGTGVLALFACQAGARKVYAIERGRIAELARRLVAASGFGDRIEILVKESTSVTIPERANVLVTETLWNFGLGEGLLTAVADAKVRLLAPSARIIPGRVELFAAPADAALAFEHFDIWNDPRLGLNLSAVRRTVLATVYPFAADAGALLAQASRLATVELDGDIDARGSIGGDATFCVQRSGTMHGLVGWFQAELAHGILLSNSPSSASNSWSQALLPVDPPLFVEPGDTLDTRIDAIGDGSVWRWRVEHRRGELALAVREHSTLAGFARFGAAAAAYGAESPTECSRAARADEP
ncbi:MAG TPA: 50S ribosomal protein L11 methyltransferase [Polyangiaceae bacterium]|nr:50S ribosomal protein L11 methyltransferase [Polyangiaceae bacterium]